MLILVTVSTLKHHSLQVHRLVQMKKEVVQTSRLHWLTSNVIIVLHSFYFGTTSCLLRRLSAVCGLVVYSLPPGSPSLPHGAPGRLSDERLHCPLAQGRPSDQVPGLGLTQRVMCRVPSAEPTQHRLEGTVYIHVGEAEQHRHAKTLHKRTDCNDLSLFICP